jgi:outer membrane biosynthesis protein TonB
MASALRLHDDPWRRLPWLAPVSLVVALLSLMGFLRLLAQAPDRPRSPAPLDVGLIELPVSEAAPPATTAAPPEPVAPPPDPEIAAPAPQEPLPEPVPEPKVETAPPPPPPPPRPQKRPPPPHPAERAIDPAPAASPRNAPATSEARLPAPEAVAPSSPVGGSAGARAIFQPMPSIPDSLRQHRLDAVAIVVFHVAPDGSATVELRAATDDPRLNQVLLEGFRRWRFFPALDHDRPIASTIELRVPIAVR